MSLNRCEFIGRLGKDPDIRATASGEQVVNLSIAVSKQWKDKTTGQKNEATTWVPIVIFGKLAGICVQYLTKGSQVYIAGEFRVRKWQDQNGQDRYSTEIVGNEMTMLGGYSGDSNSTQSQSEQGFDGGQNNGSSGGDYYNDEIPFACYMKNTIS